jgi:hypothetical protein
MKKKDYLYLTLKMLEWQRMRLDIPLIKQEEGSVDCGIAVVTMILNYYEVKKPFNEVRKEISTDQVGTYAPQLGKYLIDSGFSVSIVTRNPLLFTKRDEGLTKNKLTQKFQMLIQSENSRNTKVAKTFLDFLTSEKAAVEVKIPTIEDIKQEINNKRPLIAFLTNAAIYSVNLAKKYKRPFSYTFHTVVVSGFEGNQIIVNDPYWGEDGGIKEHNLQDFLFAMHSSSIGDLDNGCLIKIRRTK